MARRMSYPPLDPSLPRGRGRPRRTLEDQLRMEVWVSESELEFIETQRLRLGLSRSEFVRRLVLNERVSRESLPRLKVPVTRCSPRPRLWCPIETPYGQFCYRCNEIHREDE
jgi:hypothetical protein